MVKKIVYLFILGSFLFYLNSCIVSSSSAIDQCDCILQITSKHKLLDSIYNTFLSLGLETHIINNNQITSNWILQLGRGKSYGIGRWTWWHNYYIERTQYIINYYITEYYGSTFNWCINIESKTEECDANDSYYPFTNINESYCVDEWQEVDYSNHNEFVETIINRLTEY
jgi:hypothetical protein